MATEKITREDIEALVRDVGEAAEAYIRGDLETYLRLIHHADDYTLMSPFGGDVVHGFDPTPEQLAATSEYFRSGEAETEVVATYASGDLVVLAVIERQHGEVGDSRTRTGPCGSRWCSAAPMTSGSRCTATRTRWCTPSISTSCRRWPEAEAAQPRGRTRSTASVPPPLDVVTSRSPLARLVTERSRP